MKPETASAKFDEQKAAEGLWKVKLAQGKGFFKIGVEKKHGEANSIFLEINGSRKFEIGNDCDTCHFWFKCLHEPRLSTQKKIVNLPKTIHLPRPVDEAMISEISPLLDLLEKGEYAVFETTINLAGPYDSEDEGSYFFNSEFMEIWDINDPKEEGLLSGWEHYECQRPKLFRHSESGVLEKQFDFVIPLVPRASLKEENVRLYQQMIQNGDRPRILMLALYQRAIPESVKRGHTKNLHSFLAGFVLDGHHKLAAYRRAGVPAKFLTILSQKASKYFLLKEEGASPRAKLDERLAALVR
ncbi:MAG: hypothetical protein KGO96_02945 [Elusimicrobia bacterium]|nr:hypothetical protein [Elusimicrobiota bacterium]MDE2237288.1 hypothetical protein [Elusimicrobiota bacterium]MDE2424850.1 hypothetical protein [Elusimicrobiota bacterium]